MKKTLLVIALLTCYIISNAQIYVVGYEYSDYDTTASHGYYYHVKYWKNGISHTLFNTEHRINVTDIFVSDTNIYIIGNEADTNSMYWYYSFAAQGYLWHNGSKQYLTNTTQWSSANSITVVNGDVYIAGYASTSTDLSNSRDIATLWKNGVAQSMGQDTIDTYAYSVSVEDTNVYVVGRKFVYNYPPPRSRNIGVVWKNGEELFTIDDGTAGFFPRQWYFTDIKVVNGEIYVIGYVRQDFDSPRLRAIILKNGVLQYLTEYNADRSYANAICVVDNDVYVAGRGYFNEETWTTAVVWKNGVLLPTLYSDCVGMGEATDISVINNDIYVLTNQYNYTYVWKNDELIYALRPENLPNFVTTAMFINPDSLPNIAIPKQPAYNQAIKLYPNPAQSYITVELPREIPAAEFQLFDLQGRLLKREKINTHSTVNIHGLQQGIYLYKVISDRQQYNGKLLITR